MMNGPISGWSQISVTVRVPLTGQRVRLAARIIAGLAVILFLTGARYGLDRPEGGVARMAHRTAT